MLSQERKAEMVHVHLSKVWSILVRYISEKAIALDRTNKSRLIRRVSSNIQETLEQSPIYASSTLLDFTDRTRTGISKLISGCALTPGLLHRSVWSVLVAVAAVFGCFAIPVGWLHRPEWADVLLGEESRTWRDICCRPCWGCSRCRGPDCHKFLCSELDWAGQTHQGTLLEAKLGFTSVMDISSSKGRGMSPSSRSCGML